MSQLGKPKRKWAADDLAAMCRMRGRGLNNRRIALHFGVKIGAIGQCFSRMRKAGANPPVGVAADPAPPPKPRPEIIRVKPERSLRPPAAPVEPPQLAAPRTVRPRQRAELGSGSDILLRIQHQGLTAGMFGDPPPGRSALDQRDAGQ